MLMGAISLAVTLTISTKPDMGGVVSLIGKGQLASACPVEPYRAITAAHVAERDGQPRFHRWYQEGAEGTTDGVEVWEDADLAYIKPDKPFKVVYPRAAQPPVPGEKLWLQGFDFRKRDNALAPRVWEVEVLRTIAGHIVVKPEVDQGTSGSCVLNRSGEVVGIVSFGVSVEGGSEVVVLVGTWGHWGYRDGESQAKE